MKFLCGNCKAKYQIADEKVTGRTLRMKCRRCAHDILIDGHSMAQSSPPPAATATGSVALAGVGTGVGTPRRTGSVSVAPTPMRGGSGAHAMPVRAPTPNLPRPAVSRSKPPIGLSADFRRHVAAPPEVPQRTAPYDLWHVAIQDVPVGPMTRDELARKVEAGAVAGDSLCWREGMDDWRPLAELPELAQVLRRGGSATGGRRAAPSPAARPAPLPFDDDDDDDAAEPTRVTESPFAQLAQASGAGALHAPAVPGSTTSPRVLAGAGSGVSPAPVAAAEVSMPQGASRGVNMSPAGWAAIAVLFTILIFFGPMIYDATWGKRQPATEPPVATAPVQPTRPAPEPPVVLPTEAPEEPEETAAAEPSGRSSHRTSNRTRRAEPEKSTGKALTAAEQELIDRMGGAGREPELPKTVRGSDESRGTGGPTLNQQQLSKVVQDNRTQLQRCYETALRASGGKHENAIKITVSVEVGSSGTAKSVSATGDGLGNLTECIRSSVKRWRFPVSGGDTPFAFPVVFQPGGT